MTINEAIKILEKKRNKAHPCDAKAFDLAIAALNERKDDIGKDYLNGKFGATPSIPAKSRIGEILFKQDRREKHDD